MINDETIRNIENLHRLKQDGIITDAEFEKAKGELLTNSKPVRDVSRLIDHSPRTGNSEASLPHPDDYIEWAILPLRRYAQFEGRSTRKEFWMFMLIYVAVVLVSAVFSGISLALGLAVLMLSSMALFIPFIAVQIRRFHDQDRSGWLALLNLIPYAGIISILVLMTAEGTKGDNQYGPDPLQH